MQILKIVSTQKSDIILAEVKNIAEHVKDKAVVERTKIAPI